MYKFSDTTIAEFYGRQFYAIYNEAGKAVAYSEKIFEIPKRVVFLGDKAAIIFENAVIRGGVIRGGEIWGGEIWGGVIRGGEIRGGEIRGGEIRGGVIRGGEIRGGEIRGGVIWGGVIWGGVIWGGEIRGGVYKETMLQIQGSRHFCYATPTDLGEIHLGIGCKIYPIEDWEKQYKAIGIQEGYSKQEIKEYGQYIALFASRYKSVATTAIQ